MCTYRETIDRRARFHAHAESKVAICATYSPEIPFQTRIQMAHATTDTPGAHR